MSPVFQHDVPIGILPEFESPDTRCFQFTSLVVWWETDVTESNGKLPAAPAIELIGRRGTSRSSIRSIKHADGGDDILRILRLSCD